MKHNVFISYACNDKDIIENLREKFQDLDINAWVYSRDATLGNEMWSEIESKLRESSVIIFVISDNTPNASGQQKEIELVFNKIKPITSELRIMPLFIEGAEPSHCPEPLRLQNGEFLNASNIQTIARKIAKHNFPILFERNCNKPWKYPIPGEWFEISDLDGIVEEHFDIGDKLYFRTISPMGLFECYSPKIKGLFWISPENVKRSTEISHDQLEILVPYVYTISGMTDLQMRGWNEWHINHKLK